MSTGGEHSLLTCVRELTRLAREGKLLTVEAFGHVVDILTQLHGFLDGRQTDVLPLAADEESDLQAAVEELSLELGQPAELRLRPRPDGTVLPARGMLLQVLFNLVSTWASNPDNQQKIIDWITSLFGGGSATSNQ